MSRKLEGLKPENVFYYFEEISNIPRGSGNEEAVSKYIINFARERGFEVESDESNNVIIHKGASAGCENAPMVMLQNHMDMVCEKFPDCDLDFEKDGLRLAIDKEKNTVYAEGTSLGADNGIGLAVSLAILDDDSIIHGPLEVVCTVSEEVGLVGAARLDMSKLRAKYMINSDSFRLDMVQAGCAGCVHAATEQKISWEAAEELTQGAELVVGGLLGGHSGLDTCRQRTNANILVGRLLDVLHQENITLAVTDYTCVNKDNAIPRDAVCGIAIKERDKDRTVQLIEGMHKAVKRELQVTDPGVFVRLSWRKKPVEKHISMEDTRKMIRYLSLVPNGMFQKDFVWNDPNLAESSSNLGRIMIEDDKIIYRTMIRANYDSRKMEVVHKQQYLAELLGMKYRIISNAPSWEIDFGSRLLDITKECYRKMTGEDIVVAIAHGTCECGYFKAGTGCETVSIGPEIRHLHSPLEEVDIDSVGALYELNLLMLSELAKLKS